MTKMPDKIGPVCYDCGLEKGCSYTLEPLSGNCAVCGRINMFNDRVVDSDLIPQPVTEPCFMANRVLTEQEQKFLLEAHKNSPVEYRRMALSLGMTEVQPVTDEARAKALDDLDLVAEGVITSKEWLQRNYKTIEAALSQPVPMDEQVRQFLLGVGKLEGCKFGEKPETERGNFWWRKYLKQRAMDKVLSSNPHTLKEDRDEYERGVKMAFEQPEAIRTHQSELESLKAELAEVKKCLKTTQASLRRVSLHRDEVVKENAELRRAVVDLDGSVTGIAGLYLKTSSPSKRPAQILHESTIAKAKEVQS